MRWSLRDAAPLIGWANVAIGTVLGIVLNEWDRGTFSMVLGMIIVRMSDTKTESAP